MKRAEGLEKRSVRIAGHATSVALEPEFWAALEAAAAARNEPLAALIAAIDRERRPGQGLASALRVYALRHSPSKVNG